MEGDAANLSEIVKLAQEFKLFLYVDDAHAVGVFGENGWGMTTSFSNSIEIIMGTFSKALGSYGGYVACSTTLKNYFVNKCKGLIYSTGLSPAILGAISAVLELVPQLQEERKTVIKNANSVREFFQSEGLDYGNSTSQIIPWIIGDAKRTIYASELLKNEGILATAIQPPSVPLNASRIRLCLSAAHTEEHLHQLFVAVKKVNQLL